MRVAVVGGGIAGLAAARRLEALIPDVEIVLVERTERLGGKVVTERLDGFVIEAGPDSFLSRKERGVGLCEELGLRDDLVGRRPENARSYVRRGFELHPLPEGLTGMIPTNLDALATSTLLSPEGRERLAAEVQLPPAPSGGDESVAAFVSRRLGREAYERLVEPLLTGIYGGDGEQLSLDATFPNLRRLEQEHGSVIAGLRAQSAERASPPPFVTLRSGMETLVATIAAGLGRTRCVTGRRVVSVKRVGGGFVVEVAGDQTLEADGAVIAAPAFAASTILGGLDMELAELLAGIPYASSAIVTLAYRRGDVSHRLDGYGYVVPSIEGSDILACTWTSSKWEDRAPERFALLRVYAGRFGGRDVTRMDETDLVALARQEVRLLGIEVEPHLAWIHRWPLAMPQYVLGHPERVAEIESALPLHPGLALAGAAYHGVGIPDCISSGEQAAESVARALVGAEA